MLLHSLIVGTLGNAKIEKYLAKQSTLFWYFYFNQRFTSRKSRKTTVVFRRKKTNSLSRSNFNSGGISWHFRFEIPITIPSTKRTSVSAKKLRYTPASNREIPQENNAKNILVLLPFKHSL